MGVYGKPAPFHVNGKVNLGKSTDVSAGVQSKVNLAKSTDVLSCVNDKVNIGKTDISEGVTSESTGIAEGVTSESKGVDYSDIVFAAFFLVISVGVLLSPILGEEAGSDLATSALLILAIVFAIKVALDKISRWFFSIEVSNQRKQQKEDRLPFVYRFFKFFRSQDDFFGFSILMLIIFVCIEFISMDHLTIWLTALCGVGNGKIVAMLIIVAVDIIFVILQAMAFISYIEFKNKYTHEE